MTLKDAVFKSLEDISVPTNHQSVYDNILRKKYYDFGAAKTPLQTVSAVLGNFIRNEDTRVRRISQKGGTYAYYLSKNENDIDVHVLQEPLEEYNAQKGKGYKERDLHKLLSSYLYSTEIYSKTIFHEQSINGKDSEQTWTHPDMIAISFLKLKGGVSKNFLKSIDKSQAFKLISYEIKRQISSDTELKKAFFQSVSNSSWANYGYLVAFEINKNLLYEMERLNQSFGIGIIELNSNPFESKILFHSKHRELDIKTIDKLCNINQDFEKFIKQVDKLMNAKADYFDSTEKELKEFCDKFLKDEQEARTYCVEKNIPSKYLEEDEYNKNSLF